VTALDVLCRYKLRPEAAESLFVLHELLGKGQYREWAWDIFKAIEKHCRTPEAYAAIQNVRRREPLLDDYMESFFLAETLKYLYLIQDPDHDVDFNKYILTTEAHPLKIVE
jgi:hypothetical protein